MKKDNEQHNTKKGFTIVETLVAIFILLISTTGPLTFAQSGLRASFVARDQVVAFYLAQDAVEAIKNRRDNNALQNAPWLSGLSTCFSANGGCSLDTGENGMNISSTIVPLKYDSAGRQFILGTRSMATAQTSKYTRKVYIDEIVPGREAQIIVEVNWDTVFFADRRIVVQENMYNWVPRYVSP